MSKSDANPVLTALVGRRAPNLARRAALGLRRSQIRWFKVDFAQHGRVTATTVAPLLLFILLGSAGEVLAQRARGTFVPVIVNRYPGSGVSKAEAEAAIKEANKLLRQANYKMIIVKDVGPADITAAGGGGDDGSDGGIAGDGDFTRDEGTNIQDYGDGELAKLPNHRGIKVSFGDDINTSTASNEMGWGTGPGDPDKLCREGGDPTIVVRKSTAKEGGSKDTGNTIAHELGHVLGIDGDYDDATRIMDAGGRGDQFSAAEIDKMNKFWIRFKYGKCSSQFSDAFPAQKEEAQFGVAADERGDVGGRNFTPTASIYDLGQVFLISESSEPTVVGNLSTSGTLPTDEELDVLYTLGFDIDDNTSTGVSHGELDGIDRIVNIEITGNISLGTLSITGNIRDTVNAITTPLPESPSIGDKVRVNHFPGTATSGAGSGVGYSIPKSYLNLSAAWVPAVATAGTMSSILDTAADLFFDTQRGLNDPTLETFGNGTPIVGQPYPFAISGLVPGDQFNLYLNDELILTDTLDASGNYSGSFVFPVDIPTHTQNYLAAQDSTGEFAYSITCPDLPLFADGFESGDTMQWSDTVP